MIEGYVNIVIHNTALDITFGIKNFFLQGWATFWEVIFYREKKRREFVARSRTLTSFASPK